MSRRYLSSLVVPKKTAYIGEAIPLELRLYVDALDGRGYVQRASQELPATGSTALGKGRDNAEWTIGRGFHPSNSTRITTWRAFEFRY